jgi:hypothetical protein
MGPRADCARGGAPAFADRQGLAHGRTRSPAARDPDQRALDLEATVLHCPLYLDSCFLDAKLVCLDQATATGLTVTGCHLAGLTGELLTATTLDLSGSTLTARCGYRVRA